jgi:DNA-binding CsgD family transcriptional regulator
VVQIVALLVFSNLAVAWLTWYLLYSKKKVKNQVPPKEGNKIIVDIDSQPLLELEDIGNKSVHSERENEALKLQLKQKNIELAKHVKHLEDKTRVLQLLREKLNEVEFNPKINKFYWSEMDRLLDIHLENNDKAFEMQMDELHEAFFTTMHSSFPDLSVYDLRLCAYIKIGMNSKEIADLLRVLPSSINVSRSRLRKKLGLNHEEDLFSFLSKYS